MRFKLVVINIVLLIVVFISSVNSYFIDEYDQQIIESPANIEAKLGDKVILKCKFKHRKGEVQWCLDDFCLGITKELTLKGRPRHKIVGDQSNGEYNLQIEPVQLQDNMMYYCMATAASETVRAVKSKRAFLTVLIHPQSLYLDNPVHVSLNKPSSIQCIAKQSRPPVKLYLSIDNKLIDDESRYIKQIIQKPVTNRVNSELNEIRNMDFKQQLKYFYYDTIVNVTLDDINMKFQGKVVECIAYELSTIHNNINDLIQQTNIIRTPVSKLNQIMNTRSTIQVDYAPEVSLKIISKQKTLKENDVITLVCETKATPTVHVYKWYLGKSHLNGVNDDKLNLKLRKEMNNEMVTCEAANTVASVKASLQLNIIYKPYYLKGSQSFLLIDSKRCNKPMTLDCQVESNPMSNITWYKYNPINNHQTLIGYGPTYTIAAFNCGNTKVYSFNESSVPSFESMALTDTAIGDDYYRSSQSNFDNGDFGLYVCEANNGLIEEIENKNDAHSKSSKSAAIVSKRQIKLNGLGVPSLRLLVEETVRNDKQQKPQQQTYSYITKSASIGVTILLTCIVDPVPSFKSVIWMRDDDVIINSKYTNINYDKENNLISNKDINDEEKTVVYDEMSSQPDGENTDYTDDNNKQLNKFKNLKIRYENTSEGFKSYLQIKITDKSDYGLFKCRSINRYGINEVSVTVKESKFFDSLNLNSGLFYLLISCFSIVILILLIIIFVTCFMKRHNASCCSCCRFTDKDLLTNTIINENSSDKTINEWLATSSKLSNGTTASTSQNGYILSNCVTDKSNSEDLLLNRNTRSPTHTSFLQHTFPNMNSNIDSDNEDVDDDLSKMLQDTTYRLSDLFKELSPSIINSSPTSRNYNELTLSRKTLTNTKNRLTQASLLRTTNEDNEHSPIPLSTTTTNTHQYQTTIHSNMKNIPYTTLTKHNSNTNRNSNNNNSNTNNNNNTNNTNEYSKYFDSLSKIDTKYQTIV